MYSAPSHVLWVFLSCLSWSFWALAAHLNPPKTFSQLPGPPAEASGQHSWGWRPSTGIFVFTFFLVILMHRQGWQPLHLVPISLALWTALWEGGQRTPAPRGDYSKSELELQVPDFFFKITESPVTNRHHRGSCAVRAGWRAEMTSWNTSSPKPIRADIVSPPMVSRTVAGPAGLHSTAVSRLQACDKCLLGIKKSWCPALPLG